ncbi:MAG: ribonuclease E/G, partial [Pseudomonadota bacterium]
IDMDERKNNSAVEKRMKDRLKTDRARIQIGRISGFGLMEMSRQRLRPGMIEATTQPCPVCHGTGLIRSDDNLALSILRQIEEEAVRRRSREVLVRCPVGVANFLMNQKREHVAQIEARYGLSVRIEGDAALTSPEFTIEKFKTASRVVKQTEEAVVSADLALMDEIDAADEENIADEVGPDDEERPRKRRRRRRRRSRSKSNNAETQSEENAEAETETSDAQESKEEPTSSEEPAPEPEAQEAAEEKPKPKRKPRSRKKKEDPKSEPEAEAKPEETADQPEKATPEEAEEKPKPKRKPRARKKKEEPAPEEAVVAKEPKPQPIPEPAAIPEPAVAEAAQEPPKPKRRGWWSS